MVVVGLPERGEVVTVDLPEREGEEEEPRHGPSGDGARLWRLRGQDKEGTCGWCFR